MAKGSIIKVKKKRGDVYAIRFYDQEGNRHYRTIGERKTDAIIELRQELAKVDRGEFKPLPNITAKEFFEKWLETKKSDVRTKTFYFYKNYTNNQISPYFETESLNL